MLTDLIYSELCRCQVEIDKDINTAYNRGYKRGLLRKLLGDGFGTKDAHYATLKMGLSDYQMDMDEATGYLDGLDIEEKIKLDA